MAADTEITPPAGYTLDAPVQATIVPPTGYTLDAPVSASTDVPTTFPVDAPGVSYGQFVPVAHTAAQGDDFSWAAPEVVRSAARGVMDLIGRAGGMQEAATEDNPDPSHTLNQDELGALMVMPAKSIATAPATASAAADVASGAGDVASKLMSGYGDNPTAATRAAKGEIDIATPAAPATSADVEAMKNNSYAQMRASNETYPQAQFADPIAAKIDSLMPQPATANGVLSKSQQTLANSLTALKSQFEGQDITGEGVDRVGRDINAMLQDPTSINPTTNELNENGATIAKVKGAIQDILNADPTTGSVSGYNGRVAASTEFSVAPIDAALKKSEAVGTAASYRAQAAKLYNDPDYFSRLDPKSQDLLKTAATNSIGDKLTSGGAAHVLSAIGGVVTGAALGPEAGMMAGAGLEAGKVGLDALKASAKRAQLTAFLQSVIDNGMSKIKPVPAAPKVMPPLQLTNQGATLTADSLGNISHTPNPANQIVNTQPRPIVGQPVEPAPPTVAQQLLLPAPGKASALRTPPMTDTGVSIARRLMNNPPARELPGSGIVIDQPQGIPASPLNIAARLKRRNK